VSDREREREENGTAQMQNGHIEHIRKHQMNRLQTHSEEGGRSVTPTGDTTRNKTHRNVTTQQIVES